MNNDATITVPKTEYQRLQKIAERFELVKTLMEPEFFQEPPVKDPKAIIKEFRGSGSYNEAFLQSLEQGLNEARYLSKAESLS